ncbi:MAG: carbonic anhydrase family protein, partial [Nitrospinota bacterium]|nr:carbonic anhydrase family protein [Nitrospinota bacterium]
DHWADLDPAYEQCGAGTSQSPVNLGGKFYGELPDFEIHYQPSGGTVVNNGHTIMFTPTDAGYIVISAKRYNVAQIHFHSPSEHTVNNGSFAMESHIVHKAEDGTLAVVATLFKSGAANSVVDQLFSSANSAVDKETTLAGTIDPQGLLFWYKSYFRYAGSLTTPPCSEGVNWTVLEGIMSVSEAQAQALTSLVGPNARPIQPLNGRFPTYSAMD